MTEIAAKPNLAYVSTAKLRVLYLYAAGEFPTRKTVWSFIYSFRRFSTHSVYYHNVAITTLPFWIRWVKFDVIVFSHFMTSPWNPKKFEQRMKRLASANLKATHKVAFFQDEFFHTELRMHFLRELGIDQVYSVAPSSQWATIYPGADGRLKFHSYLTGYVDPCDVDRIQREILSQKEDRAIDVGYRTGWPSAEMFRLGDFGALKFKIAEVFQNIKTSLKFDVRIGEAFYTGWPWFQFLGRCRFTLGVESGSSLLDADGTIYDRIKVFLANKPDASYETVKSACFAGQDGNLDLKAISPRIFEAAMTKTAMILVEGNFNGILKPHVHYVPIKADFSDVESVLPKINDEAYRLAMVEQVFKDIIASGRYSYARFVEEFFNNFRPMSAQSLMTNWSASLALFCSKMTDIFSWLALALRSFALRCLAKARAPLR